MLSARESVSHSSTTKACFFMQRRRPCSPERMTCKQGQAQPRSHLLDLHDLLPDDSARALTILRNTCSDRSQSPFPGRSAVEVDTDALDSRQRRRPATSTPCCTICTTCSSRIVEWTGTTRARTRGHALTMASMELDGRPRRTLSAQDTLGRHPAICSRKGSLNYTRP